MKKGLILEGGAMRGMFTVGVTDTLMEEGIVFDGAVGVSAGAAFGCNYKSGQIGRAIRYNERFCRDKRYCGLGVLLKTGDYYSTDFCYREVPLKYDVFDFDAFEKNPMEFYVVCTDVETGKSEYHLFEGRNDHDFDWIRASASMPLVSNIVEIDGKKYLDGGISDSIPVEFFERIGYERSVAVLTRPQGYEKKKNRLMPFIRRKYREYPHLVEAMERRHLMYNETLSLIEEKESAGSLFVFRPKEKIPVGRTERDPKKLRLAYEMGREAAKERLEELKEYLGEEK